MISQIWSGSAIVHLRKPKSTVAAPRVIIISWHETNVVYGSGRYERQTAKASKLLTQHAAGLTSLYSLLLFFRILPLLQKKTSPVPCETKVRETEVKFSYVSPVLEIGGNDFDIYNT